jgi:hypothetical protein
MLLGQFCLLWGILLRSLCYPVSSVGQIEWPKKLFRKKPPNLYVEIRVEQSVMRTKVVNRSLTPTWDEELPL